MTREEVVEYLCQNYNFFKKDVSTIKGLVSAGEQVGFSISHKGDDYSMVESCAIIDFKKPLKVIREMPSTDPNQFYNGVPIGKLMNEVFDSGVFVHGSWCYLANKDDGDLIEIDEDHSVKSFDLLSALGYLNETKKEIEFYLFPQESYKKVMPHKYITGELGRVAPIIR